MMNKMLKNDEGYAGLIVIALTASLAYFLLNLILIFLPEPVPLLDETDIIYAATSSKVYPNYQDTLYDEFEEAKDIPFDELIVTVTTSSIKEHDNFKQNTMHTYPLSDISSDVLSNLGLTKILEDKYQSMPVDDLVLLITEKSILEAGEFDN